MNEFKRKPLPADITEALRTHASVLPAAVPASQPGQGRGRAPKTVQVNFNASEAFARVIAGEAARVGGTRRLFARLMRDAGHDVPEADLNPPDNRRRWT